MASKRKVKLNERKVRPLAAARGVIAPPHDVIQGAYAHLRKPRTDTSLTFASDPERVVSVGWTLTAGL